MVFGLKLGRSRKSATEEVPDDAASKEPAHAKSSGHGKKLTVNEFIARTKRCREKGLEPTGPELIAYARYLGIDPIANHDLMWIADEALNAPLPPDWTEHHDNTDRVFYYNTRTRESSWTHPLEKTHRDLYKSITEFRGGGLPKEEQVVELMTLRTKCEESEREAQQELQAWSEHVDDQGQKFYYNSHEERSSWTDPRPARCHCLYLQMKQLRVLSKHCGRHVPHSARERENGPAPLGSNTPSHSADTREVRKSSVDRHCQSSSGRRGRQQSPDHVKSTERNGRTSPDRQRQHCQAPDSHRSSVGAAEGAPSVDDGDTSERRRRKKRLDELKDDVIEVGSLAKAAERRHAPTTPGDRDRRQAPATPRLKTPKTPRQRTPAGEARETRATFGVLPSLPTHNRPLPGTLLNGNGRLPSPPGDGLSTHGRAKVRAGIRLEPLKGGA